MLECGTQYQEVPSSILMQFYPHYSPILRKGKDWKMYYACLILLGLSLVETYKIHGRGVVQVGEQLSKVVAKNLKNIRNDFTSLQFLVDYLKSADVDFVSGLRLADLHPTHSEKWTNSEKNADNRILIECRYDCYPSGYPDLSEFKMDDLSGDTDDKLRFLDFVTLIAPVYKMLIGTLNTDFKDIHGKPYPLRMLVHDFLQIAKHFNVGIISNGGEKYGVDWSSHDGNLI